MLDRSASGREIVLQAGDYEARIVTVGAGLAGLRYRARELVVPHGVGECPPGYLGKVLMPWPNRIAGGSYSWEGTSYDLPVDEPRIRDVPARLCHLPGVGHCRGRLLLGPLAHAHRGALFLSVDAPCIRPLQPGCGGGPEQSSCPRRTSARARPPTASDSTPTWPSTMHVRTIWSWPTPRRSSTRPTRP